MPALTRERALEAIEAIFGECFRTFAALPGATVVDNGEVSGVVSGVPLTFFNGIATTALRPDLERAIERAMAPFVARNAPFRWWISPSTRPASLPAALIAQGMKHAYDATGMAADLTGRTLDGATPADLVIVRATDAAGMQDWSELLLTAFARPAHEIPFWIQAYTAMDLASGPWTHLVGYADGRPVATTSVLCRGRLAGIYHVATREEARGRGYGSALTLAAMRHAQASGATDVVLQASEMAVSVYRSLGFEAYCDLSLYDWRPA